MANWKMAGRTNDIFNPTYTTEVYVRTDENICKRVKKAFLESLIGLSKKEVLVKLFENEEYGFEEMWVYTSGKNIPKEINIYRSHGCGVHIYFNKITRRVDEVY